MFPGLLEQRPPYL